MSRRWYERLGVEPPLQWLPIVACSLPFALIVFAVALGIWWWR